MKYYITNDDGVRIGETIIYETIEEAFVPQKGKKIALVIGHDANSQGAYGNAGKGEWEFWDNFVNDLVLTLPKQHEYYIIYRKTDIKGYTDKMIDVHKQIDKIGCEVAVEFHFNSVTDSSVNGNEVLYCVGDENGKALAEILDRCFDELPNRDRGIKGVTMKQNGGGFCCRGNAVSILSEPFFGANQKDFMYNQPNRKTLQKAFYSFFNQL